MPPTSARPTSGQLDRLNAQLREKVGIEFSYGSQPQRHTTPSLATLAVWAAVLVVFLVGFAVAQVNHSNPGMTTTGFASGLAFLAICRNLYGPTPGSAAAR